MTAGTLTWQKLGRVYMASGDRPWAQTHAYVPTAVRHRPDRIRVYAAFLDTQMVGRVGYVDVAAEDPTRVLAVSQTPCLDIGKDGSFDDHGVTPSCIVDVNGVRYLYYLGWQLDVRVRYHVFNGLAASTDGGETFRRISTVPVTDRADRESAIRSAAHVRLDDGIWRMWYAAGDQWRVIGDALLPSYDIRYLESGDGVVWGSRGAPVLELCPPDEFGLGRPWILKSADRWQMWYSIRRVSTSYRLGYAESADGRRWERRDELAGIDVSPDGWDSEMICFASVVTVGERRYLFYNGNRHGATGFGVAVACSLR